MEIPDDRDWHPHIRQPAHDFRNGSSGFVVVDGDSNEFAASCSQLGDLKRGIGSVGSIRVRHGLHDDRIC